MTTPEVRLHSIGLLRRPLMSPGHARSLLRVRGETLHEELVLLRECIAAASCDPTFRAAVRCASPSLAAALFDQQHAASDKAIIGAAKYLLRASLRPTPFGLFARTGAFRFGTEPSLSSRWAPLVSRGRPLDPPRAASRLAFIRRRERIVFFTEAGEEKASIKYDDRVWRALLGAGEPRVNETLRQRGLLSDFSASNAADGGADRLDLGELAATGGSSRTEAIDLEWSILPRQLADAMRSRARVAARATGPTSRAARLQQYHQSFLEAYTHEWVSLDEVADPQRSSVPPPWSLRTQVPQRPSEWTRWLTFLQAERREGGVALRSNDLPVWTEVPFVEASDIPVLAVAPSVQALLDGNFSLLPSGVPGVREAYQVSGRFLGELPDSYRAEVLAWQKRRSEGSDQVDAELVWLPEGDAAPTARTDHGWPAELVVCGPPLHPDRRLLHTGDIVVRAIAGGQFELRLRSGERLQLHKGSMFNPARIAPPGRLAWEMQWGAARVVDEFDWGDLRASAFLPRVSVDGHVLSFARWRVPPGALKDHTAFLRWCDDVSLPAIVSLRVMDQKLPLNSRAAWSYAEIRRSARHNEGPTLEEAPWADLTTDQAVLAEFIASADFVSPPLLRETSPTVPISERSVRREWKYFRIIGSEIARRRTLLALAELCRGHGWHYVRYSETTRGELRFRALATSALSFEQVDQMSTANGCEEIEQLQFRPEVGRYGGEGATSAALLVHHLDSVSAADLWAGARDGDAALVATARWLAEFALAAVGHDRAIEICRKRQRKPQAGAEARRLGADRRALQSQPLAPSPQLVAALSTWRETVPAAAVDFGVRSFLHMAANRRVGTDPHRETVALALAEQFLQLQKHVV